MPRPGRLAGLVPIILAMAGLAAPGTAAAHHSYPATYTGTAAAGTVELDVNAAGTAVTRFAVAGVPTTCGLITSSATGSYAITDHAFAFGTVSTLGLRFTGSFPSFQQASGEFSVRFGFPTNCTSASVPWTATTSAPPPPQCNDAEDNDGDGLVDFPADPGCLSAGDNEEFSDTTAPAAPAIGDTDPDSPANDVTPQVKGSGAEPGSTVRIYAGGCSGAVLGTGPAADFNGPGGVTASVPANQTTRLHATATDAADNTSSCSAPFDYTEDSTAPETTITSGPPSPSGDTTPTFSFASSEPGAAFECHVDAAAFAPCASPLTTPALADGPHVFSVRSIDQAGNVDASPAAGAFTIDTTVTPVTPGTPVSPVSPVSPVTPVTPVTPTSDTTIEFIATVSRTQRAITQKGLIAYARCPVERCTVRLSGYVSVPIAGRTTTRRYTLKLVRRSVEAGSRVRLRLTLTRTLTARIRSALRSTRTRGRVSARITISGTDASGNRRTRAFTVRITR